MKHQYNSHSGERWPLIECFLGNTVNLDPEGEYDCQRLTRTESESRSGKDVWLVLCYYHEKPIWRTAYSQQREGIFPPLLVKSDEGSKTLIFVLMSVINCWNDIRLSKGLRWMDTMVIVIEDGFEHRRMCDTPYCVFIPIDIFLLLK